jgi:hypothetical protein
MLGFHLGFNGTVQQNGAESDLNSTLGVNLRSDFPLARYVLLGPLFQFGAWQPAGATDHSYYVDVDFFVRARIPIELGSNAVQLWGGMPIGATLDILSVPDRSDVSSFALGWNFGALFGGAFHFDQGFGLFGELGWLQHRLSHGRDAGSDVEYVLSQWVFNVGLAFTN